MLRNHNHRIAVYQRTAGHHGIFAVLGYGRNGITFSQIASEIVATTIAGREDTDAKLFAFGRAKMMRKLVDLTGKLLP